MFAYCFFSFPIENPSFWPHLCAQVIDHRAVNFATPECQGFHKNNSWLATLKKKIMKNGWPRIQTIKHVMWVKE